VRGKSVLASLLIHAAAWAAILGLARPIVVHRPPPSAPIEISVLPPVPVPVPVPAPDPASPVPAHPAPVPETARALPRASAGKPLEAATSTETGTATPAAPGAPRLSMRMRTPGAGSDSDSEVHIPRPEEVGQLPGPPPADQLPPGALGGPVRAPRPYVPVGDPRLRDMGPRMQADGDGGYKEDRARFVARIDRDGRIQFSDKGNVQVDGVGAGWAGLTLFGSFDLTDAVLRSLGDDPYAYEKMRIMERTREARAKMAMEERSQNLREALRKMPRLLEKVWAHESWTAAQRRRLIFALWDEVEEDGDDELRHAGAGVRAAILSFIRRVLPQGSPEAFTAEELEAMNRARRSRARFEPYSE
jgi:hypothetical protein